MEKKNLSFADVFALLVIWAGAVGLVAAVAKFTSIGYDIFWIFLGSVLAAYHLSKGIIRKEWD